jgi:hypothetical protein
VNYTLELLKHRYNKIIFLIFLIIFIVDIYGDGPFLFLTYLFLEILALAIIPGVKSFKRHIDKKYEVIATSNSHASDNGNYSAQPYSKTKSAESQRNEQVIEKINRIVEFIHQHGNAFETKQQPSSHLFANRYALLKKIGVGGFSEVWKAGDTMAEDSIIALKIYAPERGMDDIGLKQFRREYASVLNLNHTNLLTARHFDVHEGRPYLVMSFIEGGSLAHRLHEIGRFSEQDLITVLKELCSGLAYLHKNNIMHQDIKPDNVLIGKFGDYLLTDFGISSRLRSTLRKSTTTGAAMTIAYAPPERFDAVPRSVPAGDIFSLGVMAYELATGDVPWMGNGGMSLKQGADIPVLSSEYSEPLRELVRRMMSLDPNVRPDAHECEQWLNGEASKKRGMFGTDFDNPHFDPSPTKSDRRTKRFE